jgi:hypothetical protein
MRRTVALITVLAGVAGVAVACTSSGRRPTDPACVRWFEATKSWSERCGVPITGLTIGESRRFHYEAVCERALYAKGATSARSYLETCAAKLDARECSAGELLDCEPPPGALIDGAACAHDFQCRSGWCQHEFLFGSDGSFPRIQTCGRCAPRLAVGQSCNEARLEKCAYGTNCVNFACDTATAGEGQRCASGSSCGPELRCEPLVPAGARCERRLSFGSPCFDSLQCASGLACAGPLGEGELERGGVGGAAPAGTCRELQRDERCSNKRGCLRGLGCDPDTLRCTPIKYVSRDEACDENVRRCKSGLCVHADFFRTTEPLPVYGVCLAYFDDGGACENDLECEPPAICGPNGKCELPDPDACQ